MRARVRVLSYGRRAALGPLAAVVVAAHGAPGTIVPVPRAPLSLTGAAPSFASLSFKRARVKTLSLAPLTPGAARAPVLLFPAQGTRINTPPTGALSLTGFIPSATTASKLIFPPPGGLVLTGQVSDDGIGIAGVVVGYLQPDLRYRPPPRAYYIRVPRSLLTEIGVPSGGLTLTAGTPLVDATGNLTVAVLPGSLALLATPPDISGAVNQVDVPLASLGVTGLFPVLSQTFNVLVLPDVGGPLLLTGTIPILPPGPASVGVPLRLLLLTGMVPRIVTVPPSILYVTTVVCAPSAGKAVVAPYALTLQILRQ